jgi:hypothetical protein
MLLIMNLLTVQVHVGSYLLVSKVHSHDEVVDTTVAPERGSGR